MNPDELQAMRSVDPTADDGVPELLHAEQRARADQLRTPTVSRCYQCAAEVVDGPEGGYCCGQCSDVVEPSGRARRRT